MRVFFANKPEPRNISDYSVKTVILLLKSGLPLGKKGWSEQNRLNRNDKRGQAE